MEALGGSLHVSVNTAGGGIARRTLSKDGPHPLDEFRSVIELNLISSFNVARLVAAHMARDEPEDGERGVVISTASIAAFEGQIGQVAYTAAKAGIAGMVLTMARDLGGLGIRALAIAPSLFSTGLTSGIPDEFAEALTKDAAFPSEWVARRSSGVWSWRSSRRRCSTGRASASTRDSASPPGDGSSVTRTPSGPPTPPRGRASPHPRSRR